MLPSGDDAALPGVPSVFILLRPCKFQRLFDLRPPFLQPFVVAHDLPLAVGFDDAAHLAVHAGHKAGTLSAQRQLKAESHAAVVALIIGEVQLAHRPLQPRKEEWQRESVVPDVRAAALAAAGVHTAALPAVEFAVRQAQTGRALEHGNVGADRVQRALGQIASIQRLREGLCAAFKLVPARQSAFGHLLNRSEHRRVEVLPVALQPLLLAHRFPVVDVVGHVPRDDEANLARLARLQRDVDGQRRGIHPVFPVGIVLVHAALDRAGGGKVMPEHAQIVKPRSAEPVLLNGNRFSRLDGHHQATVVGIFGIVRLPVVQLDRGHRVILNHPCFMRAAVGIAQRQRGGIIDRSILRIGQRHGIEARRNAGSVLVERNERIKRRQRYAAREFPVLKRHLRKRKRAFEFAVLKMRPGP